MKTDRYHQEVAWLLHEKHGDRMTDEAKKDIERLRKGKHVDYVIGWVEFLGCTIDLSLRPLIPRPETEYWTEKAIAGMKNAGKPEIRCLDMFSGSGCIGIAILKHVPSAFVDFGEKEKAFCEQIVINTALHAIDAERFRVIQSDLFERIEGEYDYIMANPPYIAHARKALVQESVLQEEPEGALFAGEDGFDVLRPFVQEARRFLKKGGMAYLEFDSPQKKALAELFEACGYSHWQFRKDQYGRWRYAEVFR